jgi:hypothetical protein
MMMSLRRLTALFSMLIIFCAVVPPELVNLAAQDQNLELEKDSAEKEIDDNDGVDLKMFSPPPNTAEGHLVSFAQVAEDSITSLYSEEVPTPPPLFR